MVQALIARVVALLTSPGATWDTIDGEAAEPKSLILNYVAPLAAIPAIATFIGTSMVGISAFGATYRVPFGTALTSAVLSFVFAIVGVYVFAAIVDALAPNFGGKKDFNQALKVSAYAPTAGWVAGAFALFPALAILGLVGGLYSLYLLFVGLPKLMKPEEGKATTYTVVSIVCAIVLALITAFIVGALAPKPNIGGLASTSHTNTGSAASRSASAGLSETDAERRAADLEAAAQSGDLGAVLGALTGGEPSAGVADSTALRALAPEKLVGLSRTSLDVESMSAPVQMVSLNAVYEGNGQQLEMSITNSSALSMVFGGLGLGGASYDRSTDDGYEKLRRDGDVYEIEEWSRSREEGRYGRAYASTFMVEAEGSGVPMAKLKRAVDAFPERKLMATLKSE